MDTLFKPAAITLFTLFTLNTSYSQQLSNKTTAPKIQVAVLLDVSNSMDGLIAQAKSQLWNMVSILGRAECNGNTPVIEIALYEYGSPRNDAKKGYVKQINGFSTDLDQVSKNLFALTTNGGDEYCGHVIHSSLTEMKWDESVKSYKVIFIAGNEDFLQGNINFTKACEEAKKKGVIVNTIYCGDKQQGIREHWNLGGECGNGSYTNINQDAKEEEIPTPYDSTLFVLNNKLNQTYIGYGLYGYANVSKQAEVDQLNYASGKSTALKRAKVKANYKVYNNASWDLVDAEKTDSSIIAKVDRNTLADSLKNKSTVELQKIVAAKKQERGLIQKQIEVYNDKREAFILEERKRNANNANTPTLESEIEKIIREQVKRFDMVIK
jgi:chorismate mutase